MTAEELRRQFYLHIWPLRETLLRTARFLTHNSAEAEDLAQETMLKAYRALESLDTATSAKGWLMTILRHTRIDSLRRKSKEAETRTGWVSLDEIQVDVLDEVSMSGHPPTPEEFQLASAIEAFSDERIITALKELPEEIRLAVLLVDVEEFGYTEAARIMGVPHGTAKSRVFRGHGMLRAALEQGVDAQ